MAFQNTKERYASFGAATAMPPEVIDQFWTIIDHNLKDVFDLNNVLIFKLSRTKTSQLTIEFYDKASGLRIVFDTPLAYDPFLPHIVYIIDNQGIETILLNHEIT